jgi:hypothetical protein
MSAYHPNFTLNLFKVNTFFISANAIALDKSLAVQAGLNSFSLQLPFQSLFIHNHRFSMIDYQTEYTKILRRGARVRASAN